MAPWWRRIAPQGTTIKTKESDMAMKSKKRKKVAKRKSVAAKKRSVKKTAKRRKRK